MSALGTIPRLAATVVSRTAHVVSHPVSTARSAAGLARGAAGVVATVAGKGPTTEREAAPGASVSASEPSTPSAPEVTTPDPQAAAGRPPIPVADSADPVTTEPSAPSRNAAHGGPGDDAVDDWREELDEGPDVETPVGTTGAGPGYNPDTGDTDLQQPGTEPLMDPSLTKAVRSEAETLSRAADPDKE